MRAEFAESLRAGAESWPLIRRRQVQVSISIGVAAMDALSRNSCTRFAAAETACKAANDRGRNRVEVYQEADESIVRRFTDIDLVERAARARSPRTGCELDAQLIVPLGDQRGRRTSRSCCA